MRSTTERTLLFALLVSSLVPLLALGLLAAATVERAGRDLENHLAQAHQRRFTDELAVASQEAAERVSTFLGRRAADLRTLTLLPRTPDRYRAFHAHNLGPGSGPVPRARLPLYRQVAYRESGGSFAAGLPLEAGDEDPPRLGAPRPASSPGTVAPFQGPLRFEHPIEGGSIHLDLDPAHLAAQIFRGDPDRVSRRGALLFVFAADGRVWHTPPTGAAGASEPWLAGQLARAIGQAPASSPWVEAPGPGDEGPVVAYAPVTAGDEAGPLPNLVGGLLMWAAPDSGGPSVAHASGASTRATVGRIALLTLASAFGVALAALLVARRTARPWARLGEKARAVVATEASATPNDDLDAISHSFDRLTCRAEESAGRLRIAEDRLGQFIAMSPDGIAVTDDHGRFHHANRALCQMVRQTPGALAHGSFRELLEHPGDWDDLVALLVSQGVAHNHAVSMLRGDGTCFEALLTARLAEGDGSRGVDIIARDVSSFSAAHRRDREKTETLFRVYGELARAHQALRGSYAEVEDRVRQQTEELRTAYEALQASDRVKTDFLMRMSHELRTPLNSIIGYSEALSDGIDGPVTEDQGRSLARIANSGRHLLRLIEDLLDHSRLEAGRMEFRCTATPVEDAVRDVVHQARPLLGGRPIVLEVAIDGPLPPVWADPDRLRQVLWNLVGNAVKFTDRGQVRLEARARPDRTVEVAVRDTGPGIPPEELETIFAKFAQLPGNRRSGAGLGLAICRELVEHMGGRVWAESEIGQGSVFRFTLPAAAPSGQLQLPLGES